tara:strand:- start:18365 stop:18514 length:150 start_codon:yes stop_codon:yes gene_type:complete
VVPVVHTALAGGNTCRALGSDFLEVEDPYGMAGVERTVVTTSIQIHDFY